VIASGRAPIAPWRPVTASAAAPRRGPTAPDGRQQHLGDRRRHPAIPAISSCSVRLHPTRLCPWLDVSIGGKIRYCRFTSARLREQPRLRGNQILKGNITYLSLHSGWVSQLIITMHWFLSLMSYRRHAGTRLSAAMNQGMHAHQDGSPHAAAKSSSESAIRWCADICACPSVRP
jgi:hypothetical protein